MALVEVRYKGLSDVREITKKQWLDQQGVEVSRDTVWHAGNRFTQVIDANDRMLEVLKAEGHFSVKEINDDNSLGDEIVTASEPDREPDVVVDGNTGQRSENKRRAEQTATQAGSAGGGTTSTSGSTGRGRSTQGDG